MIVQTLYVETCLTYHAVFKWYPEVLHFQFICHNEEEKLAQMNLPFGQMMFLLEPKDGTAANYTKDGLTQSIVGFHTKNMEAFHEAIQNN
ncbi:hypothetical protein HNO89_001876 [Sporosarcina luteola]|nr:hypothetical protein [Sporosarcina luteola]